MSKRHSTHVDIGSFFAKLSGRNPEVTVDHQPDPDVDGESSISNVTVLHNYDDLHLEVSEAGEENINVQLEP